MEMVSLSVQARTKDASPKQLRKDSVVPCILYGNDTENMPVQCEHNELMRAYMKAGESTLVELEAGGKKIPVLFHSIDFHPVSERITHVDFYAVDMKKEIEAKVPVHTIGEAPAVKDLGGVLVTALDHVTVKCLPSNLPHALEVDISSMEEFGDQVLVSAIKLPENVIIMENEDQVIANVQEPRRIAVEEVATEGEEGEEGEAAEGDGGEAEGGEGGEAAEGGEGEKAE